MSISTSTRLLARDTNELKFAGVVPEVPMTHMAKCSSELPAHSAAKCPSVRPKFEKKKF